MPRKRARKVQKQERREIKTKRKTIHHRINKKMITVFILIGIFGITLFMNSYFNYTSGIVYNSDGSTLGTRFFLSGPDPYYNMRLCTETLEKEYYPYLSPSEGDPLLNYPAGLYGGARPPLFNMIAVSSANILSNFMPQMDALGWCMLFLPAIYGALLIFPVYGIGKELFNRKAGLISALFVSIIPAHIGSGHGSAFSLFDHDSFLLLLFACVFFFFIKSLKEKNFNKSLCYAGLAGLFVGAIQLTWAAAEVILLLILAFMIVQMLLDILRCSKNIDCMYKGTVALGIGYGISLPLAIAKDYLLTFPLYVFVMALGLLIISIILKKLKLPWIITLPGLAVLGTIILSFFYMISSGIIKMVGPLHTLANVMFGSGIYGSKVALTIGEAHAYGISQTVMMIGPVIFWLAMAGFIIYLFKTYQEKIKSQNLFFLTIFIIQFWMLSVAGRFLNDLIPVISIFAGFVLWFVIEKVNFKQMIRNIKSIGGFRGFRKGIKYTHIFGICFILLTIMPNTFLALDASTPPEIDAKVFGEGFSGAFGNSVGQQVYWADVCYWLSLQDNDIEDPANRPGILTWWDYGFYLSSMSGHPTVADNFQNGLQCAGNFHTAQTEEEAVAILIVRLTEGTKEPKGLTGIISEESKNVIRDYFPTYTIENNGTNETINKAQKLIDILEDPTNNAPSSNTLIAPEYGNKVLKVSPWNAMYHDAVDIITELTDEEITNMYIDMMEATGFSIRYYGIEARDMRTIFGVFPFLSDKSTHGYTTLEDDWYKTVYVDTKTGMEYTEEQLNNMTRQQLENMDITTRTKRKDNYFNSMAFKAFYGYSSDNTDPENRAPAYMLKHFKAEYISPYVSLLKYYEGAKINGTVMVGDYLYNGATVYVLDEYGIPHDAVQIKDGKYNLIMPAGNITIALYLGQQELKTKTVGIVSEEKATRQEESNYSLNFEVDIATMNVNISGISNESLNLTISSQLYPSMVFNEYQIINTSYLFENIIPDYYNIYVTNLTGNKIYDKYIFIQPGQNNYNIELRDYYEG